MGNLFTVSMNNNPNASAVSIPSAAVLGKHLRAARLKKGLTQRDLAKQFYCSLRWITEVENGKDTARIGKVLALCQFLELEVLLANPCHGNGVGSGAGFGYGSGASFEDSSGFGGGHGAGAGNADGSGDDYPDLETIMGGQF